MRLLPAGERAVLVEVAGIDEVLGLAALVHRLREADVPAWRPVVDVVPAATTVLITVANPTDLAGVTEALRALPPAQASGSPSGRLVQVEVTYDGPDLAFVAEHTGLGVDGVVSAHTGREWVAAFSGFAPGFAYLTAGDPRLVVPRRAEPRTIVPAGSVGLAGTFSGVYPRASPGGWQLIGRAEALLWDERRDPPALLSPGTRVRFVAR